MGCLKSLHAVYFRHDCWGFLFEKDIVGKGQYCLTKVEHAQYISSLADVLALDLLCIQKAVSTVQLNHPSISCLALALISIQVSLIF